MMKVPLLLLLLFSVCATYCVARDPFCLPHNTFNFSDGVRIAGIVEYDGRFCCLVCNKNSVCDGYILRKGDTLHGYHVKKISQKSLVLVKEKELVELSF